MPVPLIGAIIAYAGDKAFTAGVRHVTSKKSRARATDTLKGVQSANTALDTIQYTAKIAAQRNAEDHAHTHNALDNIIIAANNALAQNTRDHAYTRNALKRNTRDHTHTHNALNEIIKSAHSALERNSYDHNHTHNALDNIIIAANNALERNSQEHTHTHNELVYVKEAIHDHARDARFNAFIAQPAMLATIVAAIVYRERIITTTPVLMQAAREATAKSAHLAHKYSATAMKMASHHLDKHFPITSEYLAAGIKQAITATHSVQDAVSHTASISIDLGHQYATSATRLTGPFVGGVADAGLKLAALANEYATSTMHLTTSYLDKSAGTGLKFSITGIKKAVAATTFTAGTVYHTAKISGNAVKYTAEVSRSAVKNTALGAGRLAYNTGRVANIGTAMVAKGYSNVAKAATNTIYESGRAAGSSTSIVAKGAYSATKVTSLAAGKAVYQAGRVAGIGTGMVAKGAYNATKVTANQTAQAAKWVALSLNRIARGG